MNIQYELIMFWVLINTQYYRAITNIIINYYFSMYYTTTLMTFTEYEMTFSSKLST